MVFIYLSMTAWNSVTCILIFKKLLLLPSTWSFQKQICIPSSEPQEAEALIHLKMVKQNERKQNEVFDLFVH